MTCKVANEMRSLKKTLGLLPAVILLSVLLAACAEKKEDKSVNTENSISFAREFRMPEPETHVRTFPFSDSTSDIPLQ